MGLYTCRRLIHTDLYERAKEKAAKEEKQRKRAREDFADLLDDTRQIKHDTTWEEALPHIEKEPEYKAARPPLDRTSSPGT